MAFQVLDLERNNKMAALRSLMTTQFSLSRVSEWLLFNCNPEIFQRYHSENKLIVSEMMMRSALYWINTLSKNICIVPSLDNWKSNEIHI